MIHRHTRILSMVFVAGLTLGLAAGEFNETLYRQYLDKYMQEMKATNTFPEKLKSEGDEAKAALYFAQFAAVYWRKISFPENSVEEQSRCMVIIGDHIPDVGKLAEKYPESAEILTLYMIYVGWVPMGLPPFESLILRAYPFVVNLESETWQGKRPPWATALIHAFYTVFVRMLEDASDFLPLAKQETVEGAGPMLPKCFFGLKPGWESRDDARMWVALARWYFVEKKNYRPLEEDLISYEKKLGLAERMPLWQARARLAQCVAVRLNPENSVSKSTLERLGHAMFNKGYQVGWKGNELARLSPKKQRQLLALERKILKLEKCDWAANETLCDFYAAEELCNSPIYPPARFVSSQDPEWLAIRAYYQLRVRTSIEIFKPDALFRAQSLLKEALLREPESARAHALMAWAHMLKGEYDEAKRQAAKARALDANDPILHEFVDPELTAKLKFRKID